ncbi:MAG: hypothetical protein V3V95_07045 [Thermodesulfobacteriota bacterium]
MMKNPKYLKLLSASFLFAFLLWGAFPAIRPALAETSAFAVEKYSDPNGFFKITPPSSWRVKQYQGDPRGKVAFIGPGAGIGLRVLASSVDFDTIDDLVEFSKGVEERLGVNTNIRKITFNGRPAVERMFHLKGQKFYVIDFLVGKIDHNLQYAAPSRVFDTHHAAVMKSIETYESMQLELSRKQILKHKIAKRYHFAKLMLERGQLKSALMYAYKGLAIAPTDPELLKLKDRIKKELREK